MTENDSTRLLPHLNDEIIDKKNISNLKAVPLDEHSYFAMLNAPKQQQRGI